MRENFATLPAQTTTMAHNDSITAAISQVMHIAGLTMQGADLQKTTTERVRHWRETLSRVTLPQNFTEPGEKLICCN